MISKMEINTTTVVGAIIATLSVICVAVKMYQRKIARLQQDNEDYRRQIALSEQIKQREIKVREKNNEQKENAIRTIARRRYFNWRLRDK